MLYKSWWFLCTLKLQSSNLSSGTLLKDYEFLQWGLTPVPCAHGVIQKDRRNADNVQESNQGLWAVGSSEMVSRQLLKRSLYTQ